MRRARVKAVVTLPVRRKPANAVPQVNSAQANSENSSSENTKLPENHLNEVSQSSTDIKKELTALETLAAVAETRKKSINEESSETIVAKERSEPIDVHTNAELCEKNKTTDNIIESTTNTQTSESKIFSRRKILRPAVNIPSSKNRLKPQTNKSSPRIQSPIVEDNLNSKSPLLSPAFRNLKCPRSIGRSPKSSPSRYVSSETSTVGQRIQKPVQASPPKSIPAKITELAPSTKCFTQLQSQDDSDVFPSPELPNDEPESIDGITPLPPPRELDDSSLLPNDYFFDPIIPLPSPTKVRPKLKPAPRLSNRRNSVHGSASESEEELRKHQILHIPLSPGTKQRQDSFSGLVQHRNTPVIVRRESTRIRTESFSSVNSERLVNPTTGILGSAHSKDKASSRNRHVSVTQQPYTGSVGATSGYGGLTAPKRDIVRRRTALVRTGQPRSSFTMYDLIFSNPTTNNINDKSDKKEGLKVYKKDEIILPEDLETDVKSRNAKIELKADITKMKEDYENDADDEAEAMPVPQLKLGPNGEIMLDEKSLVVDSTALKLRAEAAASRGAAVIHENDRPLGSRGTYTRAERSKDWSPKETIRFYRALACIGPDFAMLASFFPGRTRHHLKMKYKKEERLNKALIDFALSQMSDYDFQGMDDDLTADLEGEMETAKRKDEAKTIRKTRAKRARTISQHRQICAKADESESDSCQISTIDNLKSSKEIISKNAMKHGKRKSVETEANNVEAVEVDNSENSIVNTVQAPPQKIVKVDSHRNKHQYSDAEIKNINTTKDSSEDIITEELQNSVEENLTNLFAEPDINDHNILYLVDEPELVKNYRVVENGDMTEITEPFDESDLIEESAVNELLEDNYELVDDQDFHVDVEASEDEVMNNTPLDKINIVDDSYAALDQTKIADVSDVDVYESNVEDSDTALDRIDMVNVSDVDVYESNIKDSGMAFDRTKMVDVSDVDVYESNIKDSDAALKQMNTVDVSDVDIYESNIKDSDADRNRMNMVDDSDVDVYEPNIKDFLLKEDPKIDVEQETPMIDLVHNSRKDEIEETDEDLELSSVTVPIAPLPERLEAGSLVLMMTTMANGDKIPRAYLATTAGPNPNLRPIDLPPNVVQTLIGSIGVTNIKLSNPKVSETDEINTNIDNDRRDDNYCITIL